jgi:hypothetical protein
VPHQLLDPSAAPTISLYDIYLWCGSSARGAGPPSALGACLAEHPPSVGESLPYNPSVPLAEACGVKKE